MYVSLDGFFISTSKAGALASPVAYRLKELTVEEVVKRARREAP